MNLDQMISTLTGAVSPTKTNNTQQTTTQAISNRSQTETSQKRSQRTDLNGMNKLNNKKNVQQKTQYADNQFNRMYLNGASTNKTSAKIYDSSMSSDSECDRRLRSSSEDEDNIRTTSATATATATAVKAASAAAAAANSRRRNVSPTKKKPAAAAKSALEARTTEKKKRRTGNNTPKSIYRLFTMSNVVFVVFVFAFAFGALFLHRRPLALFPIPPSNRIQFNSFVLQPYESKNHLVVRVKMKMSNEFDREEPPKTLIQPIPMHPKSNRQKAVYFGKWNGSLQKKNCPVRIVMNWCRFATVWVVLAP